MLPRRNFLHTQKIYIIKKVWAVHKRVKVRAKKEYYKILKGKDTCRLHRKLPNEFETQAEQHGVIITSSTARKSCFYFYIRSISFS
jgi:hypothetical protein